MRDHDADVTSDGWEEHERKADELDKKVNDKIYDVLKSNAYGKYFGMNYKPGQWEAIFGKKNIGGESGETNPKRSDDQNKTSPNTYSPPSTIQKTNDNDVVS